MDLFACSVKAGNIIAKLPIKNWHNSRVHSKVRIVWNMMFSHDSLIPPHKDAPSLPFGLFLLFASSTSIHHPTPSPHTKTSYQYTFNSLPSSLYKYSSISLTHAPNTHTKTWRPPRLYSVRTVDSRSEHRRACVEELSPAWWSRATWGGSSAAPRYEQSWWGHRRQR